MHIKKILLPLHPHYRSNAQDDSLAQLVEHNTFNVGVLGSSPRRITETTRKIKQIPDNQTLSGISFFWQVAENSRFKHIIGGQIVGLKFSSKKSHEFAYFSLIHSLLNRLTLEKNT